MGGGFEWIFLVGFLVIFYLMIWRPQAKRAKEQKNLLSSLQRVMKWSPPAASLARSLKWPMTSWYWKCPTLLK